MIAIIISLGFKSVKSRGVIFFLILEPGESLNWGKYILHTVLYDGLVK